MLLVYVAIHVYVRTYTHMYIHIHISVSTQLMPYFRYGFIIYYYLSILSIYIQIYYNDDLSQ